jgi:hypothetical protein
MGNESPKLPDPRESLGKYQDFPSPKIQFSSHEIRFSSMAFHFFQWLSAFFNGFPIFLAFRFFSTAFHFPRNPRKSIYGDKYTKDHYLSFVFFATRSPSFVISATIPTSHPTIQNGLGQHPVVVFSPPSTSAVGHV